MVKFNVPSAICLCIALGIGAWGFRFCYHGSLRAKPTHKAENQGNQYVIEQWEIDQMPPNEPIVNAIPNYDGHSSFTITPDRDEYLQKEAKKSSRSKMARIIGALIIGAALIAGMFVLTGSLWISTLFLLPAAFLGHISVFIPIYFAVNRSDS